MEAGATRLDARPRSSGGRPRSSGGKGGSSGKGASPRPRSSPRRRASPPRLIVDNSVVQKSPNATPVTTPVNLGSSPNSSTARHFLDTSLGADWSTLPVGRPNAHRPLLAFGVLQKPTLFRIDEMPDFGGLGGSTYLVWGLGPVLVIKGNYWSRHWGHNRMKASVGHPAQPVFQLAKSRHKQNPFRARYSYRVLKPGQRKSWRADDVLFTMNRDIWGRGFLGIKDEWRIYQGRERDGKMVYYCVRSWMGWSTRCWHNKAEYESGRGSLTIRGSSGQKIGPCAVLSQVANAGAYTEGAPDQYYLFVNAGEDSALLLSFGILYDSTEDQKDAKED